MTSWYEAEECPLSSSRAWVRTYDHGWCWVLRMDRTPNSSTGLMVWCDCGRRYRIRERRSGDDDIVEGEDFR